MTLAALNARHAAALAMPSQGKRFVLGEGNANQPSLLLVGEAPGAQEEALGRPFVGKAGQNLDHFLSVVRLERGDLYITNAVKFRPTRTGPTGRLSNRTPTGQEVALFLPWLREEIRLVNPRAVVTLGNTPLRALAAQAQPIGQVHGQWMQTDDGFPLFPLYHPAALIYRRELAEVYESDLRHLATDMSAR